MFRIRKLERYPTSVRSWEYTEVSQVSKLRLRCCSNQNLWNGQGTTRSDSLLYLNKVHKGTSALVEMNHEVQKPSAWLVWCHADILLLQIHYWLIQKLRVSILGPCHCSLSSASVSIPRVRLRLYWELPLTSVYMPIRPSFSFHFKDVL